MASSKNDNKTMLWRSKLGKDYDQTFIQKNEIKFKNQLDKIRRLPDNRICADCHHPHNQTVWASVNLGIFLCLRCGSIHRGLGTHISKPKGCTGSYIWSPDEIERMTLIGNKRAKEIYNHHTQGQDTYHHYPSPDVNDDIWKQRIRKKYENKSFMSAISAATVQSPREIKTDFTKSTLQTKSVKQINSSMGLPKTNKTTHTKVEGNLLSFEEVSSTSNFTCNPKTQKISFLDVQSKDLICFEEDESRKKKNSVSHSKAGTTSKTNSNIDFFAQFGL